MRSIRFAGHGTSGKLSQDTIPRTAVDLEPGNDLTTARGAVGRIGYHMGEKAIDCPGAPRRRRLQSRPPISSLVGQLVMNINGKNVRYSSGCTLPTALAVSSCALTLRIVALSTSTRSSFDKLQPSGPTFHAKLTLPCPTIVDEILNTSVNLVHLILVALLLVPVNKSCH
ncbi:unnamed protein product [Cyclocybe aegerita]|uniref:Uncharacterized protein n=1 Tax=Cyclocybe aegerita TaxID=1973307 RepID=A0A8S0VY98_CYCAE|nr:unnamed protein product [Cyclocybe aegerita]